MTNLTSPSVSSETYQSLMERCEIHFPHASCVRISICYKLSKYEHRSQTRKDEFNEDGSNVRYWEHIRRVNLILLDEAHIIDEACVIEGIFHDSLEDTRLSAEEISFVAGPDITKGVLLMSKKPKQGFLERLRIHASWRELVVKIADRIDNIRHLKNSSPEFRAKQLAETRDHYFDLADLLLTKVPEEHRVGCVALKQLLMDAWKEASSI